MKIKGYWEIIAKNDGGKGSHQVTNVIKARTIGKAIKLFYNRDYNWYLVNNYKVISIRPLEVEVLKKDEKER